MLFRDPSLHFLTLKELIRNIFKKQIFTPTNPLGISFGHKSAEHFYVTREKVKKINFENINQTRTNVGTCKNFLRSWLLSDEQIKCVMKSNEKVVKDNRHR